jgi:hypothetical protein
MNDSWPNCDEFWDSEIYWRKWRSETDFPRIVSDCVRFSTRINTHSMSFSDWFLKVFHNWCCQYFELDLSAEYFESPITLKVDFPNHFGLSHSIEDVKSPASHFANHFGLNRSSQDFESHECNTLQRSQLNLTLLAKPLTDFGGRNTAGVSSTVVIEEI